MKKLLIVGGAIIFIAIGSFLFVQYKNMNDPKYDYNQCVKNGGKVFIHSAGNTCEMEAVDVGKQCKYDDECEKNNCAYQNEDANYGNCDGYIGDNDGKNNCHYHRDNNQVTCDFIMS